MKLLFICTHNRCRSILAEAITNHYGDGVLIAKSAGSQPSGKVHPLSIQHLSEADIPTNYLRSKSWDEHKDWNPDIVITVCDSAAGESCPLWFGEAIKIHWGLTDPSNQTASLEKTAQDFKATITKLASRIDYLMKSTAHKKTGLDLINLLNQAGKI